VSAETFLIIFGIVMGVIWVLGGIGLYIALGEASCTVVTITTETTHERRWPNE